MYKLDWSLNPSIFTYFTHWTDLCCKLITLLVTCCITCNPSFHCHHIIFSCKFYSFAGRYMMPVLSYKEQRPLCLVPITFFYPDASSWASYPGLGLCDYTWIDLAELTSQPFFGLIKMIQKDCLPESMAVNKLLTLNELVHVLQHPPFPAFNLTWKPGALWFSMFHFPHTCGACLTWARVEDSTLLMLGLQVNNQWEMWQEMLFYLPTCDWHGKAGLRTREALQARKSQ